MKIKVGELEQDLNFGVKFVRELDKVAGMSVKGAAFGMGLTKSLPALQAYDPAVLSDVMYCGSVNCSPRAGRDSFDDLIDASTEKQLGKLFDDVIKAVKESNALKIATKNMRA